MRVIAPAALCARDLASAPFELDLARVGTVELVVVVDALLARAAGLGEGLRAREIDGHGGKKGGCCRKWEGGIF